VLDRRELQALNVKIVKCEQPTVILGHAFTTGGIARRTFERVLPNTLVSYRPGADSVGCNMPAEDAKAKGEFVQDQHVNEHATCFNVKGRGLVVISSCGHAGIVNSVRQAIEVSGEKDVHAVLGGFHLSPAPEPYIAQTVQALKELEVDYIIPMHCSGAGFIRAVQRDVPDRSIMSYTGTRYIFGA
jgi:7,8-dihydropterin-6-yl-methyl-4-(beta-D-ribofuranosyl)aminobenzene 5'-phosphate synthase